MPLTLEPTAQTAEAVRVVGASKRFGTVTAVSGVDLILRRGEIHALLGENGAGKTTLVKMLAGLEEPDDGTVELWGTPVSHFDARSARGHGVALVQQHFTLVPTLTASQNLVLAKPRGPLIPPARVARQRLAGLIERFGLDVRDGLPVAQLSVGEQQRLEILRALDADATILLLDEPTAVLTGTEATALLDVCRRLAEEGRAIVIITHRLAEVLEGCDRVTVLRDGAVVLADAAVADHTVAELADAMVGRAGTVAELAPIENATLDDGAGLTTTIEADVQIAAAEIAAEQDRHRDEVRLEVSGVSLGMLQSISFAVRASEVLGVAGVDGNGQTELEAVLAGVDAPVEGTISLDGRAVRHGSPRERIRRRIAYIPSDRYRTAIVRPMSLADNLELGRGGRWRRSARARQRTIAPRLAAWDVRSAGPAASARTLSGGNAQKLVLARELEHAPDAVIACHPTRGLDPVAASTVASRVLEAARAGAAVVWMGAELEEVLAVSHRVIVLSRGRISGEFSRPFDRTAIGLAMGGGT